MTTLLIVIAAIWITVCFTSWLIISTLTKEHKGIGGFLKFILFPFFLIVSGIESAIAKMKKTK